MRGIASRRPFLFLIVAAALATPMASCKSVSSGIRDVLGVEPTMTVAAKTVTPVPTNGANDIAALLKAMDSHKVGDRVKLSIARQGGEVQLEVVLEEMPSQ
jgi:hypothetical protein